MENLITVIIPAYNAQKTIKRAVNSIIDKNVEIIIIIDGGTDNTLNVCEELRKNNDNIKIITQENKGAFNARKVGIENANGKYIMFLDADDYFLNGAVNTVKEVIKKYDNPDLIRFRYKKTPNEYNQYKYFEEDELKIQKEDFVKKVYPMFLEGYMLNALWTNCVKSSIVKNITLDKNNIRFAEDLLVNLEIFSNIDNVVFINNILYNYTFQENSITNSRKIKRLLRNLNDALEVYSLLYSYLIRWNMYEKENVDIVSNRIKKECKKIIEIINNQLDNN